MEVDQLLSDLPPPAAISTHKRRSPTPSSLIRGFQASPPHVADGNLSGSLQKLASEERALQSQVNQLTDKREKLAHELQDLLSQVSQCRTETSTLVRWSGLGQECPAASVRPLGL